MAPLDHVTTDIPLGIGYYSVPEAARLLRMPALNIRRWLGGYSTSIRGERRRQPPLWRPELPVADGHIELCFRDLIELRFVNAFVARGVGLRTIRACIAAAREAVNDERPFSTQRFRTDGRSIFLDTIERQLADAPEPQERQLLDLKRRQYVLGDMFDRSFKGLDLDAELVVRWRPFHGKDTIVIDPKRAFGQPIATSCGIPTATLATALEAEGGSHARVAWLYGVDRAVIRDAMKFESELAAA